MKVVGLDAVVVKLPFRFSFKHSLASRNSSENLIVRARIEDGGKVFTGYGEGIPRDYVTGETIDSAMNRLKTEFFPRFISRKFTDSADLVHALEQEFLDLELDRHPTGAAWCPLELALLDALGHAGNKSVTDFLGGAKECYATNGIEYGGVIPFGGKRAVTAVLWFYKFFGFGTIKIKLGRDDESDLELLRLARSVVGNQTTLRVDINCAWNVDQTIRMAEKMRKYGIVSIEQPVPADDLAGLAKITRSIPELVMVDESLCTIEQARLLASEKICSAFNVRVSKVGGLLAARDIVKIGRDHGMKIQMGAQVGESGLLSAAGRAFASCHDPFDNCEGSNNLFLLKHDLTEENLNVGYKGRARLLKGPGLGVTIKSAELAELMNVSEVDNRKLVASN
jgi:L-alanine-DL-glutamate epimerase-like enolase superfamily enzyme